MTTDLIIRLAIVRDVGNLGDMAYQFYEEGKVPGRLVPEVFERTWRSLIEANIGVIFLLESSRNIVGGLGAIKCPDPNNGEMIASELFWFVEKEYRGSGLKLLKAFEAWAQEQGIKKILMVHLSELMPGKLKKLYERMGYKELETHYIKEVF